MSANPTTKIRNLALAILGVSLMLGGASAVAQTFDSGSDGSDGALDLNTPGEIDFFDPGLFGGLDPDGDGVYHFTAINVASGVTLTMKSPFRGAVVWLATGDVTIDGDLDLNGDEGHAGDAVVKADSIPGAGGYAGGRGGAPPLLAVSGNGPGGGEASQVTGHGAGGSHFLDGESSPSAVGGTAYGNVFLLPLVGGSGGGGGTDGFEGAGGAAGGGAILIASSTSIRVDGSISAAGGFGGVSPSNTAHGGGGSGGAIRLVAPLIDGSGSLSAVEGGGPGAAGNGSIGRVRLEAFQPLFSGPVFPFPSVSVPNTLFIPEAQIPVRITQVNGVAVPVSPTGSFLLPDVVINAVGPATLDIEAHGIPTGTEVEVTMVTEDGIRTQFTSTPLVGTVETSTATASVTIPHGLARFFARANWTP